jgi:hypothetical protein
LLKLRGASGTRSTIELLQAGLSTVILLADRFLVPVSDRELDADI